MRESGESGGSTGHDADVAAGGGVTRRGRAAGGARPASAAEGAAGSAGQRLRTPDDLRAPDAPPPEVVEEQVRRRAYELYQARGGAGGSELDDWVRAETEVRGRSPAGADRRPRGGADDAAGMAGP